MNRMSAFCVLFAACSTTPNSSVSTRASANDVADHDCQIVLENVGRIPSNMGGFKASADGWYIFEGSVLVAAPATDGATVKVVYRALPFDAWSEAVVSDTGETVQTMRRFHFVIDKNTVRQGTSSTSLQTFEMHLIPVLLRNGVSEYDHNRIENELADYVLNGSNNWSIDTDPTACVDPTNQARIEFNEVLPPIRREGAIVAGGGLALQYQLSRQITRCTGAGAAMDAFVKFELAGQLAQVRMVDKPGAPGYVVTPEPIHIPRGTTHVQVWFHATDSLGCSQYDSALGHNYQFDTEAPPKAVSWAGNAKASGGQGLDCTQPLDFNQPLVVNPLYLGRNSCAQVEAQVYVPGLTDTIQGLFEDVVADVEYGVDGKPVDHAWLDYLGHDGNNMRFGWRFDEAHLPSGWMSIHYVFRFSTDGVNFYRVGDNTSGMTTPYTIVRGQP